MARSSTTFQKGAKPGPGRPGIPKDLKEAAKQYTQKALDCLVYWTDNRESPAAVKAAEVLLDRGWGKSSQALEVSGSIEHTHEHFVITASADWLSGLLGEQPPQIISEDEK